MQNTKLPSMQQMNLQHKRVLIREDLNLPIQDGVITDATRLQRAIPTIRSAVQQGAKVMVLSHMGRPEAGTLSAQYSLALVAEALQKAVDFPVLFSRDWIDGVDVAAGSCVLCENVRFLKGEMQNDVALAQRMAALCDVFVMDAFASAHRAHASTVGVAKYAPVACAGPLLLAELDALQRALGQPQRPVLAIVGGAKVSSKMQALLNLLERVDAIIVGGGMANTFLKAAGMPVGASLYEEDWVEAARDFMHLAAEKGVKIPLPQDVVVAATLSAEAVPETKPVSQVQAHDKIFDIGPQSFTAYLPLVESAATIVWNGPLGVFELPAFAQGTLSLAQAVANSSAFSIAGGGDTLAALNQFGLSDQITYLSTGGGAFLEFLEGKKLPAVEALEQ